MLLTLSSTPRGKRQLHSSHRSYQNLGVTLESTLLNLTCDLFAEFVDSIFKYIKALIPSYFIHWPHFDPNKLRPQSLSKTAARVIPQGLLQVRHTSKSLHWPARLFTTCPPPLSDFIYSVSFAHSVPAKLAPRMPLNMPGAFPSQGLCTCCFCCQDASPAPARHMPGKPAP